MRPHPTIRSRVQRAHIDPSAALTTHVLLAFGWLLFAVLAAAPWRVAAEEAGEPPATVTVMDQVLVLNGHGRRVLLWTPVYRCALYLPTPSSKLSYIMDDRTPKALTIRVLYDDIPDTMPSEWRSLFLEELSRELFGRLKGAYSDIRKNDRLLFAYAPGSGTAIFVNDRRILVDPGHGLIEALLDQWIGERPVSKNLQMNLMNFRATQL